MDDTIYRQDAIKALCERCGNLGEPCDGCNDIPLLYSLPSATQSNTSNALDCIGRQAALDECLELVEARRTWETEEGQAEIRGIDAVMCALHDLPSAQPGWIPWGSGRFPEQSGTYTVTAYDGATKRVTYAKYQKRLKRWELTGARAYWRVLAWMEKPKPWEGVQE